MRLPLIFMAVALYANAELVDRIAIVVGKSIIKDSDLNRHMRVTQFLNGEPPRVSPAERQKAAKKLIDQVFLREEIRTGDYPAASDQEVDSQLELIGKARFRSDSAFQTALTQYGIDAAELREQIRWQLTVLHFVDERFKPAAIVQDAALENYVNSHEATLRRGNPKATTEELNAQAREILTSEEVNRLLFAWLDQRRKDSKISFHEEGLT